MLDWKRIDKHPPPKRENHDIALCDARIEDYVIIASWDAFGCGDGFDWLTVEGKYHLRAFTHWAEIGPLPTMETGASAGEVA